MTPKALSHKVPTPGREIHKFTTDEIDSLLERMTERGIITLPYTVLNMRKCAKARARVYEHKMSVHTRTYPHNNTMKAWLVTR